MGPESRKNFINDQIFIAVLGVILWCVVGYVLRWIYLIVSDTSLKVSIVFICMTALLMATASLLAVIVHLKKNERMIYEEKGE